MPWGRVDDGFYDHPKLDRLGKDRLPGAGLYWITVSWCNRYLTDGHVPRDRVIRLGGTIKLAEALVAAELWERDGKDYRIHDFLEFNESRAEVIAKREAEAEKKRRQRAAGADASDRGGDGRYASRGPSRGPSREMSPQMSLGDTGGESSATVPLHTRPLPSNGESGRTGSTSLVDGRPVAVVGNAR